MDTVTVLTAFGLTMIAGLSTGIGSLISVFAKRTNKTFVCASLGFSAGVMLYISFMEMIPRAKEMLILHSGDKSGSLYLLLAFFGGMGLITLIDFAIPKSQNPHEVHSVEDMDNKVSMKRMGLMVALSITIHNFPEGIATFITALNGMEVAIPMTVAIALHNIPEGIAVSVPVYHATGSKKKAFWISFMSGFSEPVGAVIAWLFLMPFWTPLVEGIVLSAVAGIMVFISIDELLPGAEKYGKHHVSIAGVVAGMLVMGVSMLFL